MQSAMMANDETRRVMTFGRTNDSTGFSAEIPTHGGPHPGASSRHPPARGMRDGIAPPRSNVRQAGRQQQQ